MHKQFSHISAVFLFTYIFLSTVSAGLAANEREKKQNPLTPKALAIRYWDRSVHNNLPKPSFILSKVSPLSVVDAAMFEELVVANTLSTRLPEFCFAAQLFCLPDVMPSLTTHSSGNNQNFTDLNNALWFLRYNRNSTSHDTKSSIHNNNHNFTDLNNALWFLRYNHNSSNNDTSSTIYNNNQNFIDLNNALWFLRYNRNSTSHDTKSSIHNNNHNFTELNNALWFLRYSHNSTNNDIVSTIPNNNQNFTDLNNALWFLRYNHNSASHTTNSTVYNDNQNFTIVARGSNVQVQPGMFFREMVLKEGNVIPVPDIRDKNPKRSFLPRSILTKLPFSSSKLNNLKRIFRVSNNSFMDKMIVDTVSECEWAPNQGEIKRCVGSLEDMIDFATYVLGHNVTVRTTENVNGSNKSVMVGQIKVVKGGKDSKFVACHQILFPYLLYYCHSTPKARVYEVDLLDPKSKSKINHGVAVCHLDTTSWSPTHNAFLALGFGPGQIEVCHWIFENNMIWTTAH